MRNLAWAALVWGVAGCDSGGVGDPCTPEDEIQTDFNGFALEGANVESGSFQCSTRVCLANHFQGRVSCPYGQTEADLELPTTSDSRCRIPGTDGSDPRDAIRVAVPAWDLDRPADQTVYCSCRCAGSDENARYCKCPSGFECAELVPDLGVGKGQLTGSYCIREGTRFQRSETGGATCRDAPNDPACPEPRSQNP